jgi:predicted ATPase
MSPAAGWPSYRFLTTVTASPEPMVGRDSELSAISDLLDALDAGAPGRALQVAGEPGIGKSRLLRELCASAQDRGCLVLSGRAAEFEGELPFGVFGDALDGWLAGL